jgi:hypothetical protein
MADCGRVSQFVWRILSSFKTDVALFALMIVSTVFTLFGVGLPIDLLSSHAFIMAIGCQGFLSMGNYSLPGLHTNWSQVLFLTHPIFQLYCIQLVKDSDGSIWFSCSWFAFFASTLFCLICSQGGLFIVAGFSTIAISKVKYGELIELIGAGRMQDSVQKAHAICGIVVLVMIVYQIIIGFRKSNLSSKGISTQDMHALSGILLYIVSLFNCALGVKLWFEYGTSSGNVDGDVALVLVSLLGTGSVLRLFIPPAWVSPTPITLQGEGRLKISDNNKRSASVDYDML